MIIYDTNELIAEAEANGFVMLTADAIRAVIQAERERCAKIADSWADGYSSEESVRHVADRIADEIRQGD